MNWTSIAILSAATYSVVNTIDSHLLSKRLPGLRAFLLPIGIMHLVYALILLYLFPLPEGISTRTVLVASVSAILRATAVIIMLYNLKKEEVSQVIPVVYTYPIFVAIIAVPVLGETLGYLHWLSIIIVVAGAVMVSVRQRTSGATRWLSKPLFILFGSSLLMAMADVTGKYALTYISFWNLFYITAFCMSGIFLLISARPRIFGQLSSMKQKKSTIALIGLNETLAPMAAVLMFWALEQGLVSLVSAIASSRPMFVLIFALILSRISPEFLNWQYGKGILTLRIIGIAMVVGGITVIYLS
ncbi:EamA family transporter [Chloroflexota bacterium]